MDEAATATGRKDARVPGLALLVGGVAWMAKFVVLLAAGNETSLEKNVEGVLWVVGALAFIAGLVLGAWRLLPVRRAGLRIAGVIAVVVAFLVVNGVLEAAFTSVDHAYTVPGRRLELVLLPFALLGLIAGGVLLLRKEGSELSGSSRFGTGTPRTVD